MPPLIIAAIITAGATLVGTGIQTASKETTDCGRQCRAKCKNETGWLFGGRGDCKKKCKDQCVNSLSPQEIASLKKQEADKKKSITLYSTIGIILIVIGIVIAIYLTTRKK